MAGMEYDSQTLRTGGKHAANASQSARSAVTGLDGAEATASPFGEVNGAGSFAGAVSTAKAHHSIGASTAATNMWSASARAGGAANLGDDNTTATTNVAPRPAPAHTVATGMDAI